jgi:uncharacterized repeat protein (TIGR03803 family)
MRSRTLTCITAMTLFTVLAFLLPLTQAQAQTLTVLHALKGGTDGAFPSTSLVRDKAGNIYGATDLGGASDVGVVFKVDTTGTETVLHSFTGTDGANPNGNLVLDKAGNLYGTTQNGGLNFGTVFKLDTSGKETVLYSFTGGTDGLSPGGLVRDKAGNLYPLNWQTLLAVQEAGMQTGWLESCGT